MPIRETNRTGHESVLDGVTGPYWKGVRIPFSTDRKPMPRQTCRTCVNVTIAASGEQQLAALYTSLGELARHFWSCFPAATTDRAEKVVKMHDTLRRFQQVKLKPFENELARNYTSIAGELTAHINQMLDAAFRKFALWKQNKQKRPPMMPPSPASRMPQKTANSVTR